MAKDSNLTDFLTDLAETIRTNEGTNGLINPQDFSDRITLTTKTITPSSSSQTYTAKTDDNAYGYKSVTVGAIPSLSGNAAASNVLSGKTFYSNSYTKQTGSMTNNGSVTEYVGYGGSYTIPEGYHDGTGTVSNSDEPGTIDVTDLTITPNALSGSWNSSTNKYVISQSSKTATMQSTVTTAGYVSSSVGTKNTGTATVSAPTNLEIPKATFEVSGASVKTTSSGAGYIPASTTVGTIGSGSVTISDSTLSVSPSVTPTPLASATGNVSLTASASQPSGYYIKVTGGNSATTGSATSGESSTVTKTAGYIAAGTNTISSTATATANASSKDQYYSVPEATFAANANEVFAATGGYVDEDATVFTIDEGSATTPTASGASSSTTLSGTTLTVSRSVTPTVVPGYVSTGTAGTVTITGTVPTETKSATGSGDITPSSGKLLSKVTIGAGSATTPATSITANPGAVTWDNTNAIFKTSTYATKVVTPTVSAGWVSSGTGGNITVSGSTTVPTIEIGATLSGTLRVTPVIQNKTASVSGKTQITVSPSTSTSGISTYYMAVETPEDVHSIQAFSEVETAGYGDTSHYGSSSAMDVAGAQGSGTYYIPLATASFITRSNSVQTTANGAGWVPANTTVGIVGTHTGSAASVSGTNTLSYSTNSTWSTSDTSSGIYASAYATGVSKRYTVSTAGWIIAGTYGGTDGTLSSSTYYLTGLTIGSGKTLNSITNNGTLSSIINNEGSTISGLSNNGTLNISSNGLSGTVEFASQNGDIDFNTIGPDSVITFSSSLDGTINMIDNSGTIRIDNNSGIIDIYNEDYPDTRFVRIDNDEVTLPDAYFDPSYYTVTDTDGILKICSLPTSTTSSSSGNAKATITQSSSTTYLNIPAGYHTRAEYYTISALATQTLPSSTSSSSSGTYKTSITPSNSSQYLNIPTGYQSTSQYYTISAIPQVKVESRTIASTSSSSYRYLWCNSSVAACYAFKNQSGAGNYQKSGSLSAGTNTWVGDCSNSTSYRNSMLFVGGQFTTSSTINITWSSSTSSSTTTGSYTYTPTATCYGIIFKIYRNSTSQMYIWPIEIKTGSL